MYLTTAFGTMSLNDFNYFMSNFSARFLRSTPGTLKENYMIGKI